jgi:hypothetical protein
MWVPVFATLSWIKSLVCCPLHGAKQKHITSAQHQPEIKQIVIDSLIWLSPPNPHWPQCQHGLEKEEHSHKEFLQASSCLLQQIKMTFCEEIPSRIQCWPNAGLLHSPWTTSWRLCIPVTIGVHGPHLYLLTSRAMHHNKKGFLLQYLPTQEKHNR